MKKNSMFLALILLATWGTLSTWIVAARETRTLREIRFTVENNGRQIDLIALQQGALASKIARLEREIRLLWGTPEAGTASWYGPGFHGRMTASGEIYDSSGATAAHPRLPMGTRVLIINLKNGRRGTARINDRGPYEAGRIIDLSEGTARRLAMIEDGLAEVLIIPITIAMPSARPGIQD